MSYPYGKTYLEQIQDRPRECERIKSAYYTLINKYSNDKGEEVIDFSLQEQFKILGEAFEVVSDTVGGISDPYHFMQDVVEVLLTPAKKDTQCEER